MRTWLLLSVLLLAGCSEKEPANLGEALTAYAQVRVAAAERAFVRIAGDRSAPPGDRARALREMARIAWLVDRDAPRAFAALARADATGQGACDNAGLRARVMEEAGLAARLLDSVEMLAAACTDPGEADPIRLAAGRAALAANDPGAAAKQIGGLTKEAGESLAGAAARLDLALLSRDGQAALKAWQDYFWLEGEELPPALRGRVAPAGEVFASSLSPAATLAAKLRLLDLLVKAGFAEPARHYSRAEGIATVAAANPEWGRLNGYLTVRAELEDGIRAAYRRQARGGKAGDVERLFGEAADRLLAAAGRTGDRREGLREAYNLYGQVSDTGGYPSLHYGHLVQDERRRITQYGESASATFRVVDNMLSNGFETWLWDGTAATGGWTDAGPVIVQVRPEWTSSPLAAWKLFSDGSERRHLLVRQKERSAADLAALGTNEVGYLAGLAERLTLQAADQVGARVRTTAGQGADLQRAFLEEYWRAMLQDAMLTHEGRHAIDKGLLWWWERLDDAELEYRAKVAELALADYPRLALININDPTIGGDSAHGKANVRVMKALATWIAAHPSEVQGFDPALPAIVQIDRLSDAQLRAIGRTLDPLARS